MVEVPSQGAVGSGAWDSMKWIASLPANEHGYVDELAKMVRDAETMAKHERAKVETLQRDRVEQQQQIAVRDERIAALEDASEKAYARGCRDESAVAAKMTVALVKRIAKLEAELKGLGDPLRENPLDNQGYLNGIGKRLLNRAAREAGYPEPVGGWYDLKHGKGT